MNYLLLKIAAGIQRYIYSIYIYRYIYIYMNTLARGPIEQQIFTMSIAQTDNRTNLFVFFFNSGTEKRRWGGGEAKER